MALWKELVPMAWKNGRASLYQKGNQVPPCTEGSQEIWNYNRNHFLCLRFVCTIFYTGSFQVSPEKNHSHLKYQFPPKIPIWLRSLVCKCSEKWLEFRVKNVNRNININSIRNNIDFLADHFFRDWDWCHFLDEWIYYYLCWCI